MDIEKLDRIVVHVHPNEYSEGVIFKNRVDDLDPEMKDIFEYHNDDKIVVRLVTDNPPENHKITIANPTLEDLYLYVFEQGM